MKVQSTLARTGAGILGLSALVVALFLLGGSVTPARAQETETLMGGNLDQGTYQVHVGSGGQIAQPFCTTNAPATVSKVRLAMRPGYTEYPETLSLTIRADSSGTPGETVHTLTNSALFDDEIPTYEDFTSSGYELAADTMYWLVMETEHRDSLKLEVVRTTNESYAEDGWSIRGNLLLFYRGEWVDWPRSTRLAMGVYASGFAPSLLPPTFPDGDCNGVDGLRGQRRHLQGGRQETVQPAGTHRQRARPVGATREAGKYERSTQPFRPGPGPPAV